MVPEKSSMGLISSRISASPERACGSSAERVAHASLPTSQSNDSVWIARRLGTSRCSVILPKETRRGANALDVRLVFAGREAGKMRPSEDLVVQNGRYARTPMGPLQDARNGQSRRGQVERQRKLAV